MRAMSQRVRHIAVVQRYLSPLEAPDVEAITALFAPQANV